MTIPDWDAHKALYQRFYISANLNCAHNNKKVYLGIHDSPENWQEIPEADVPTMNKEEAL